MLSRPYFRIQFPGMKFAGFPVIFLSFCCLLGILSGSFLAVCFGQTYGDLMRSAAISGMSVGGSAIAVFLPLLLCVVCIHCGRPKLLYGICFFKSLMLGFGAMGCFYAFGAGSWLVRLLFQFTDLISFPILCWFMLRCITGTGKQIGKDLMLSAIIFAIAGFLDLFYISPFLVMLIDF